MIMINRGHTALAQALFAQNLHLSWGTIPSGSSTWTDNPPVVDYDSLELQQELGRIASIDKKYAEEDLSFTLGDPLNGAVEVDGRAWRMSDIPTRNIYVRFDFETFHASTSTIYELGLWYNTIRNLTLPAIACEVNYSAGYPVGAEQILVDSFSSGALNELLPVPNPTEGRQIHIGTNTVRVLNVESTGLITIEPLTDAIVDTQPITAPATVGAPAGQAYLEPEDILDRGTLFMLENIRPTIRDTATRERFEYIITL